MSRAGLFGLQGTHAGCDDIRFKIKEILKTSRTFIGVFKCRLTLDEYTGELCFPDLSVFDNVRKGEALELDYGGRAYFQKGNRLGQNVEIRDTVLTGENISRMVSMQTCCDNGFGSVMNLPSGDFSFFFGQLVVRHILRLANRSKNLAGSQMAYVLYHQGFLADGEFRATSQSWYHPDLVREILMGFSEGSKLRMKIAIAKDVRKILESGGWNSNCLGGILKLQKFLQEKLHSLKLAKIMHPNRYTTACNRQKEIFQFDVTLRDTLDSHAGMAGKNPTMSVRVSRELQTSAGRRTEFCELIQGFIDMQNALEDLTDVLDYDVRSEGCSRGYTTADYEVGTVGRSVSYSWDWMKTVGPFQVTYDSIQLDQMASPLPSPNISSAFTSPEYYPRPTPSPTVPIEANDFSPPTLVSPPPPPDFCPFATTPKRRTTRNSRNHK